MKKASLINTNPFLRSEDREVLAARSTITSCGVEGIKTDLKADLDIKIPRRSKRIYSNAKK